MTQWTGGRRPLDDPEAETARKDAYWAWLDRGEGRLSGEAAFVTYDAGAPLWWRRLETPEQADYEADFMRHSIGHSWDHYSAMGDIYSLRGRDETPKATVLVQDGVVIHARESRNARLSAENMRALEALAAMNGWGIRRDRLAFDYFENPGTKNTEMRLLSRRPDGAKVFHETVLAGPMAQVEAADLSDALRRTPEPTFDAARLGAQFADLGDVEIVSIKGVDAAPGADLLASDLLAYLRDAPDDAPVDMEP